jgi:glycosyltransferase involved in cell wall biosynthesis
MPHRPLVSVIIPSYNSCRFVIEAVESVLLQSYSPIEVIVVDDGSTDDTASVLAPYRSHVRYVYQANRGLAGARNRGIAEARGELVAFLDADDVWMPEKLARQMEALSGAPQAGLVHTDVLFLEQATGQKSHRKTRKTEYVGDCYRLLFTRNQLTASSVLLRKECLTRVGWFEESLRRLEDYDLWLRVARHYPFACVGEPLVVYRLHNNNLSRATLEMRKDELYVLEKALRNDPCLRYLAGPREVRRRLYGLMAFIGYLYYEQGNCRAAHHYLSRAVQLWCPSWYTSVLWALTLLPSSIVACLRRWRRSWFAGQTPNRPTGPPPQAADTGLSRLASAQVCGSPAAP